MRQAVHMPRGVLGVTRINRDGFAGAAVRLDGSTTRRGAFGV